MNATLEEHNPGWVLIDGDRIVSLGAGTFSQSDTALDRRIDGHGDLIMPGMINTHCHMPMSLFRGLGEDVDDRLFRYILPLERQAITAEVVRIGTELAALEMILGGVTTVVDMYYFEAEVGRAIDRAGLRGVVGQTLCDFGAPDHKSFDEGFALMDALRDEFRDSPRVTASIAPHAPYSTGPEVMERVARYAADHPDIIVQMHLAEMASEMAWCAEHHNCRPVELADRTGILSPRAVMAHCLEVTADEIAVLAERGVGVAHNARSNAKAGRGIAPVEAMREAGLAVGLATDGPMSGNTLDVLSQMAPASMFAKLRGGSRSCLPATEVVKMATIEAARAIGFDQDIGSLEPGKKADLIRLSLDAPRFAPLYDIYAALVFAAIPSDVTAVMVDGRWIAENRAVQTLDATETSQRARHMGREFQNSLGIGSR